ncbi:MAG TPA: phage minor head protein [Ktedonobacterales bacterium]|nr:phage minor head protein [Ktedonobacterales bacterium]
MARAVLTAAQGARHRLLGQEQHLVSQVKSGYRITQANLTPHVNSFINAYSAELRQLQAQAEDDESGAPKVAHSWAMRNGKALQSVLRVHLTSFAQHAAQQTTAAQALAAHDATQQARHLMTVSLAPAFLRGLPHNTLKLTPQKAIDALAGRAKNGQPLAKLLSKLPDDIADRLMQDVLAGLEAGQNPRVVAQTLWRDIGMAQSQALNVARTELISAYRAAASATYQANSDVLDGWYWSAALDGRCCAMCAAMNGTLHGLDETLDSHNQCRCAMVPKTKSWADLLGPDVDTSGIPETGVSDDDFQDGADWLAQQSAETQRDVLGGQAALAAYQDGAYALQDLIGTAYSASWGQSRYQKSLKALGIDFRDYLN